VRAPMRRRPSSSGLVGRLIAPMLCIDHGTDLMVAVRDERRFERGPSLGVQVKAVAQMRAPKWTFDPT